MKPYTMRLLCEHTCIIWLGGVLAKCVLTSRSVRVNLLMKSYHGRIMTESLLLTLSRCYDHNQYGTSYNGSILSLAIWKEGRGAAAGTKNYRLTNNKCNCVKESREEK